MPRASRERVRICHLGREQDGTHTAQKALAHWEKARRALKRDSYGQA